MPTIDELRNELVPASHRHQQQAVAVSTRVESDRAIAMIEGQMTLAKKFPRNQQQALTSILESCQLVPVAENAHYSFPRGGSVVEGPTVDLLRLIASTWGNIMWNVVELERRDGESTAMVYALDLETNTMPQRQFIVRHIRDKNDDQGNASGAVLRSERDIYELIQNMGARRLRGCLEELIPPHIIGAARQQCYKTLEEASKAEPLKDRLAKLVPAFAEIGVSEAMLVKHLGGRPIGEMLEKEYIQLRNIYRSISKGGQRVEDFFEKPTVAESVAAGRGTTAQKKPAATEQAATQEPAGGTQKEAQEQASDKKQEETGDRPQELSKGQLIAMINGLATVELVNGFKSTINAQTHLSKEDMRAVRQAAGKRAQEIADAAARAYRQASGEEEAPE